MSHTYFYKKDHSINSSVLIDMIKLSTIRNMFESLHVKHDPNTDLLSTVEVFTHEVLELEDENTLITIINEYSPTCSMQVRHNIEKDLINPAMSYGNEILAKFAASNLYLGKTSSQIDAIVEGYPNLINSLITGSLHKAYREFSTMVPTDNVSQEEINEFKSRVGWFLNV